MARKGDGLHRDAFLHATVAGQADDMVVKNGVLSGIETGRCHLPGERHTHGIPDPLPQRTGRALYAGSFVKLRMTGSCAMQRPEPLHLLQWQIIAAQVQPTVKKHRTMTGR